MRGSTREDVLEGLRISPGDFVVEVGGGHQPFPRADLILDKYPFDNLHRVEGLAHAAPVLIADAVRLPIPDAGCDLLFSSHVIEHLPEPGRFLEEVQRCARRAYIEFPSASRELMFAWGFHEWLVIAEGAHLRFYRNDIPQLFGDFFHANYDFLFDAWSSRRHLALNAHVACPTSQLSWSIEDAGAMEMLASRSRVGRDRVTEAPIADVRYSWGQLAVLALQRGSPRPVLDWLVRTKRRKGRGAPVPISEALADRLMCLACRGRGLSLQADHLECGGCGCTYERRRGLFDLDVDPET